MAMATDEPFPESPSQFPTTAWSLIRKVQDPSQAEYRTDMNRFVTAYWKPVFCFLRAKGKHLQTAQDLTQEFFLHLLERNSLRVADPERGRFRNLLLTILTRFLSDRENPQRAPRQRSFEEGLVSIEALLGDDERTYEPPVDQTPETIFMKQWATALVKQVLDRLRQFYQEVDRRPSWYEIFAATHYVSDPSRAVSREELAGRLGMTVHQVRYAEEMVQKRFVQYLRQEVREQVDGDEDVGAEVRDLLALLGP
jgi:RNA polymerase sigma-70 factor (ECF subfamily)